MAGNAKAPVDQIDTRLVRKLADILTETGLTEIEVEREGLKIRVARGLTAAVHAAAPVYASAPAPMAMSATAAAEARASVDHSERGEVIKSPMVGTVYLKPN